MTMLVGQSQQKLDLLKEFLEFGPAAAWDMRLVSDTNFNIYMVGGFQEYKRIWNYQDGFLAQS